MRREVMEDHLPVFESWGLAAREDYHHQWTGIPLLIELKLPTLRKEGLKS